MDFNEKVMKTKTQCSDAPWKQSAGSLESWLGGGAQSTTSQGQPGVGAGCGNQQGTENTEPAEIFWVQVSFLGATAAALHERVTWGRLQLLLSFLIFYGEFWKSPPIPHSEVHDSLLY